MITSTSTRVQVVRHLWAKSVDRFVEFLFLPRFCKTFVQLQQNLSLNSNDCITIDTIQHELLHALGFYHMHNHKDRDDFIDIRLENVNKSDWRKFQKSNSFTSSDFGTPYDFFSVMHYEPTALSNNGQDTIVTKDPIYQELIGKVHRISLGDVQRIKIMYECR